MRPRLLAALASGFSPLHDLVIVTESVPTRVTVCSVEHSTLMPPVSRHGTAPPTQVRRAPRHFSPSEIADIRISARALFADEHRRGTPSAVQEETKERWGIPQDALTRLHLRTRAAVVLQQLRDAMRLWAPSTGVSAWAVAITELEAAALCRETTEAEAEVARAELREASGPISCVHGQAKLGRGLGLPHLGQHGASLQGVASTLGPGTVPDPNPFLSPDPSQLHCVSSTQARRCGTPRRRSRWLRRGGMRRCRSLITRPRRHALCTKRHAATVSVGDSPATLALPPEAPLASPESPAARYHT